MNSAAFSRSTTSRLDIRRARISPRPGCARPMPGRLSVTPSRRTTMDVTIIGTGNMARGIGTRAIAGGHDVTVVGKDEASAQEVVADLESVAGEGGISAAAAGDPVAGEIVVLAVYYADARTAVEQHADQLAGKTVVDITNPVNESFDALVVPPDGSATAELAELAPDAKFVKAFN